MRRRRASSSTSRATRRPRRSCRSPRPCSTRSCRSASDRRPPLLPAFNEIPMRIATANAFDSGIDALSKRQTELSALQEQMTTGKRVARASDDPAAAARAERAMASVERTVTSQRAVDASKVAMAQTESSLGSAGDLMQSARELLVAAGNGSYSDSERASLAQQLQSIRSQLLTIANQDDGAGTYLFAGQTPTLKPFVDAPGGVQYT